MAGGNSGQSAGESVAIGRRQRVQGCVIAIVRGIGAALLSGGQVDNAVAAVGPAALQVVVIGRPRRVQGCVIATVRGIGAASLPGGRVDNVVAAVDPAAPQVSSVAPGPCCWAGLGTDSVRCCGR